MIERPIKCIEKNDSEIYANADELVSSCYGEISTSILPIDAARLVDFQGLILEEIPNMPLPELVFAQISLCGTYIHVRKGDLSGYKNRRRNTRFGICHELGHFSEHQYAIKRIRQRFLSSINPALSKGVINDYVDLMETSILPSEYRKFEKQANLFGGRILVHPANLRRVLSEVLEKNYQGLLEDLSKWQLTEAYDSMPKLFSEVADIFDVNPKCIQTRIEQEKVWIQLQRKYENYTKLFSLGFVEGGMSQISKSNMGTKIRKELYS